jgi:hypothetical protein
VGGAFRIAAGGYGAETGTSFQARHKLSSKTEKNKGFWLSFLLRMLFSCLVDADFLETERFYADARGEPILRGNHLNLIELRDRLWTYMSKKRADARPTAVNALRGEILDHSVAKATLQPGLFTLTVPTGGGKMLASLSFALEHAVHNGLRRVIYVIPFTSIIEQTAEVFQEGLGTHDDILEHHAELRLGSGRGGSQLRRRGEGRASEAPQRGRELGRANRRHDGRAVLRKLIRQSPVALPEAAQYCR